MEMKTSSLIILAVLLSIIASVLLKISAVGQQHFSHISSYQECVAAGNPILESYPSQFKTPDGRTFVNPDEHVNTSAVPPAQSTGAVTGEGCVIGGCSGELCSEASAGPL